MLFSTPSIRAALLLSFAAATAGCASSAGSYGAGAAAPASLPASVPNLPAALQPPAGQTLSHVVLARGTQIYTCGSSKESPDRFGWTFRAPLAELTDRAGRPLGSHGAGPFWAAPDGSRIVGEVRARDPGPDAAAIPWLLLSARSTGGPGSFADVKSVQRVDTRGGLAPTQPCTREAASQEVGVPYTATYYFYR